MTDAASLLLEGLGEISRALGVSEHVLLELIARGLPVTVRRHGAGARGNRYLASRAALAEWVSRLPRELLPSVANRSDPLPSRRRRGSPDAAAARGTTSRKG